MEFGKFKDAISLHEGYKELEKAFTKKCQELASVKKALEESVSLQPQESGYNEEKPLEQVDLLSEEAKVVSESGLSEDCAMENPEESEEIKENCVESEEKTHNFSKREWKKEVSTFFENNKNASNYRKEIAEIIMNNSSLMLSKNPLEEAYKIFLDSRPAFLIEQKEKEESLKKEPAEVQTIDDYFDYLLKRKKSCPKVISGEAGLVSSYKNPKPKSILEAGEFVIKNYFK